MEDGPRVAEAVSRDQAGGAPNRQKPQAMRRVRQVLPQWSPHRGAVLAAVQAVQEILHQAGVCTMVDVVEARV